MYTFKPFVFVVHKGHGPERPKARSGHRIACDRRNLYSYGGFNPDVPDSEMLNDPTWNASKPLFKELWSFNLASERWTRLPGQENMPNELASNAVILRDNALIVYGGTGVPFGESCSNQLYVCNLDNGSITIMPAWGELPEPQYGQALVSFGPYIYTIGGTTGYDYTCDIHKFDLRTHRWEMIYARSGRDESEPLGRYRHELAFDGRLIYVFGGGTSTEVFGFSEIPAYDLWTNSWKMLSTYGDNDGTMVPDARRCHGCVQHKDEKTGVISVFISGGYDGDWVFSDVWRLDLSTRRWTLLRECILPNPVYFHSAALIPEGRMYIFGGIIKVNSEVERTNAVYSAWLTIPKLSEICWQALNHYYPNLRNMSSKKLLSIGIPLRFVQRFDSTNS